MAFFVEEEVISFDLAVETFWDSGGLCVSDAEAMGDNFEAIVDSHINQEIKRDIKTIAGRNDYIHGCIFKPKII